MDRETPPGEEDISATEIAEESVTPSGSPESVAGWKLPTSLRLASAQLPPLFLWSAHFDDRFVDAIDGPDLGHL